MEATHKQDCAPAVSRRARAPRTYAEAPSVSACCLSHSKTLEGYGLNALRLPSGLCTDELTSCHFVQDKKNLVLYPVDTGKTHLTIALGVKACELCLFIRFFTAASLVDPSE
ncbi:ATP-binding protein [uncultured Brevibacillus sp.]|uniref:ATP-binding protein n=1 Tax=uncultured Brevibacillus sp. TaxID=169970 RepID=UPI002596548A|nr:ATP-binding protein [uncultured Brevibacillus sp.]